MTTAPKAGELFAGQYRVERVLGTGGMGIVLAAWDETNARGIALKILQVTDANSVQRFHREARAMKRLSSDHVVKVIESGTVDETIPYLVMERLVGANLSEHLKANGGKLDARAVADIVVQACEALAHAHAAGIVHRDVKPSNLFVHDCPGRSPTGDDKGRSVVKVLDFGISKQLSREEWEKTLTEGAEGGVLGSPPYMAPEHVRDPKNVDLRADIWALGVLMHKLSTGKLPYDGDSVGEIFAKVLEAAPPPMTDLPPRLSAIIKRCLARDRNQRYPSTLALAEALVPLASPEIAQLVSSIPLSAAAEDEPSTLTVDHPPPLFVSNIVPSSVTPSASAVPLAMPEVAPQKSRKGLAIGLAAFGIAIGLGIGVAIRRPAVAAGPPPAPTMTTGVEQPVTPTAASIAPVAPSASTMPAPSAVVTAPPKTRIKPRAVPSAKASAAPERPELQDNPYNKK